MYVKCHWNIEIPVPIGYVVLISDLFHLVKAASVRVSHLLLCQSLYILNLNNFVPGGGCWHSGQL